MKNLHPKLQRIFEAAQSTHLPAAGADLEERVVGAWKGMVPAVADAEPDLFHQVRSGLWGACVGLIIICAVTYPTLNRPTDPSVILANAVIQRGLTHE